MTEKSQYSRIVSIAVHYLIFFALVAFLVTSTTSLFVHTLASSLEIVLTDSDLELAAKLTFANVIVLSVLLTVIDVIRRKLTIERTTQHITQAAKKMVQGDFSVRVEPLGVLGTLVDENFGEIINCFNRMAEELAGVETLRTDFISNVSHELKTPLSVMQNYASLLQMPELPEEKRMEYARAIADGSRRLSDMMTNILKLNRLENQQIYPQTQRFNLGEQLAECLLAYETVWESKNIELETDMEEEVFIQADQELLSLVWNNLFSNAFKFTPEGGTVAVSLHTEEHYVIVKVRDTGCGISPEVGAHIFEKFYQGDTSHAAQGNGLGLALVKRVIDILHAEISVESAIGEGSTFTIKIRRLKNK